MFENKKIFILGMARSGYEVAKVLSEHNNQITITDEKDQNPIHVKELLKLGINFIKSDKPSELIDDTYDYLVKNPGINIEHPAVKKAISLNIPVTNEVEVAYSYLPKNIKIIAITGSNGKTTTTTMIYEILKKALLPVLLGGNIGYPVCSLVGKAKENDILVLEISSHQLQDMESFKADISIMTNLNPVHLDHFGSYKNYKKQKFKIFNNQTKNDLAILNKENSDIMSEEKQIKATKIFFSSKQKSNCYINKGTIYYEGEEIIKTNEIAVKGTHNYENAMCAIIVAKTLGVSNKIIKQFFKEFKGVEHRIEFVRELNGVKYYNDSKATNTESTSIALSSFKNPTILLLGGLDRGHSFQPLLPFMKNVKFILAYGKTKDRIIEFAKINNFKVEKYDSLPECVKRAYIISKPGDIVLLSPACASWDQYENFEKRGEEFKKNVFELWTLHSFYMHYWILM